MVEDAAGRARGDRATQDNTTITSAAHHMGNSVSALPDLINWSPFRIQSGSEAGNATTRTYKNKQTKKKQSSYDGKHGIVGTLWDFWLFFPFSESPNRSMRLI